MKKKLLYLASIVLFSASSINAQTTTWDIGNGKYTLNNGTEVTGAFPTSTVPVNGVLNLLGTYQGGSTSFGAITAGQSNAGSWVAPDDTYTTVNRLATGASSTIALEVPVKPNGRALYFRVNGPGTFKALVKSGGANTRGVVLTDGTTIIGKLSTTVSSGFMTFTATLPAAGDYYFFADPTLAGGCSFFKLTVTGATVETVDLTAALPVKSFGNEESSLLVYANDGKINVSNVTSATKVSVYSVLGSLVKSIETSADASLDVNSGVYIVKVQSAEGSKTAKVIVQ
ncbi:MAG TPA: T9SS type A sorting domain-containing protein [Flavobacterium sp.]